MVLLLLADFAEGYFGALRDTDLALLADEIDDLLEVLIDLHVLLFQLEGFQVDGKLLADLEDQILLESLPDLGPRLFEQEVQVIQVVEVLFH